MENGKPKDKKSSYRGITLLPVLNKIFEKCIVSRMEKLLKVVNFPPKLQHAVRKQNNNVSLSFAMQECINYHLEQNSKVFACFLDIQQAFDKIWWDGLFYKMHGIGITDKLWLLFYDWFQGSTCSVLCNGKLSYDFTISRSIKQGGVFSMYAFCIFFHDVHKFVDINETCGLKYKDVYIGSPALADDLVLLSSTKNGLDTMMYKAMLYARKWRITYSPTKTKCMVFGEGKSNNKINKSNREFKLGTTLIEEVYSYIHIGIELCVYMSSTERTTTMCTRGNKILAGLSAIGVRTNNVLPTISLSLWRTIGLTSMLHGAETWLSLTKNEITLLEKTQCSVLKAIQNLSLRTHNYVVRAIIGQPSIVCLIDKIKLRFLRQLTMMNKNDLARCVFDNRLNEWFTNNTKIGFIPDIYRICMKYDLGKYLFDILCGRFLPEKVCWKYIIDDHARTNENNNLLDNLLMKNDVHRFLRVYHGDKHVFYNIMKRHKHSKKDLLSILKLLTIPIYNIVETCVSCGSTYDDIIKHTIVDCNKYINVRNTLWDTIFNVLDVHSSVDLFNKNDDDIIDIFLGKEWTHLKTQSDSDIFYISISKKIVLFAHNVCLNISWFKI